MSRNKEAKGRWLYVHTIDGRPAQYFPGSQICFSPWRGITRTATSLRQIRREQRASIRWRREKGYEASPSDYGYFRLYVAAEDPRR